MENVKVHLTDAMKRRLAGFAHVDADCRIPVSPPHLQRSRNSAWLKAILGSEKRPAVSAAAAESLGLVIGEEAFHEFIKTCTPDGINPVADLADDEALVRILGIDPCPTYFIAPFTPEELDQMRQAVKELGYVAGMVSMFQKRAGLRGWENIVDQNGNDAPYSVDAIPAMRAREKEAAFIAGEVLRLTRGPTEEEMQGLDY
ncbi:MAG: hypothetical protein V4498_07395 [candidate division FCPU426 bacterium]